MKNAIEVQHLNKQFPGFALQDISFTVPGGSIMGFVGENGAGKTTTIKALLGLIQPDSGEATLLGLPLAGNEKEVKSQIGVVFDEAYFHDNLTLGIIDTMMAHIFGSLWDKAEFAALCGRFGLPAKKAVKTFSRGMKMKLSIAAALAHHPKLLILDEATSGLDPIVRDEILDVFYEFIQDEEHSILFSSHITSDLEKIADYVTFIHEGRIVFSRNKDVLIDEYGIARCTATQFEAVQSSDYLRRRTTGLGGRELLVKDRAAFHALYPDIVLDGASIEDIMLFYVKGELA